MTTDTLSQEVSRHAGWSIFMGILTAAIGVVMIIYPLATATVSTVFFGAALLVAAVAQLVFAFTSDTVGQLLSQAPARRPLWRRRAVPDRVARHGRGDAHRGARGDADRRRGRRDGHRLLGSHGGRPKLVLLQRLLAACSSGF